jgi:hypothetical protein
MAGRDKDLHEDPEFTRALFGLKINQSGGGFRPLSEHTNFLDCLSKIIPQMFGTCPSWALS